MRVMQQDTPMNIRVDLENIGCLKRLTLNFKRGLNIVRAPNASGKTSFVRAFTSLFSERIPPSHILNLNSVRGRVKVWYGDETYERIFIREADGSVKSFGRMLPFADERAFDACIALAEIGVIHRITEGSARFREYLENLSYGKYYREITFTAEKMVDELSRELASPEFKRFEALPNLLTELATLHIRKENVKDRIESLRVKERIAVKDISSRIREMELSANGVKTALSELDKELRREEGNEDQMKDFLSLAGDSPALTNRIRKAIENSRKRQNQIRSEIEEKTKLLRKLEAEIEELKRQTLKEEKRKLKEIEVMEGELNRIDRLIQKKE